MITILGVLLLGVTSLLDASPVVYGTEVTVVKYPFLVFLEISGSDVKVDESGTTIVDSCGGTLIGPQTILTAAHCIEVRGEATIEAYAGFIDLKDPGAQYRKTKLYLKHEYYQPMVAASEGVEEKQIQNDVAIVWVIKPFIQNRKVQIAPLPERNPILKKGFREATLMFMGWGSTETGREDYILKEGSSKAISIDDCVKNHSLDRDENIICVEKLTKATLCFGDSGGPLVYNNVPIAVSSFIHIHIEKPRSRTPKPGGRPTTTTTTTEQPAEISCRSDKADFFMNIFPYVGWLRKHMDPPTGPGNSGHVSSSKLQGIPSQLQGGVNRRSSSPNRKEHNQNRVQDSNGAGRRSGGPSREVSPNRIRGNPSRESSSPSRVPGSPNRSQGNPSGGQGSSSIRHGSPGRRPDSPNRTEQGRSTKKQTF